MDAAREQQLLDEIAKRDAIIERLSAENLVLRQKVDALTRRIFGVSSEKLDPAQLELMLGAVEAKKPDAADSADAGPAAEIKDHKKRRPKTRAPRIPDHLPVQRQEVIPVEVQLAPAAFRRIGEEVREQLGFSSPLNFSASSWCAPNTCASPTPSPSPSSRRCRHPCKSAASPPPA